MNPRGGDGDLLPSCFTDNEIDEEIKFPFSAIRRSVGSYVHKVVVRDGGRLYRISNKRAEWRANDADG